MKQKTRTIQIEATLTYKEMLAITGGAKKPPPVGVSQDDWDKICQMDLGQNGQGQGPGKNGPKNDKNLIDNGLADNVDIDPAS